MMKTMQTEKPKKRGLSFILRLILTVAVCAYALYRCAISAYAADTTLTLAQTLALYGTHLDMSYHSTVDGYDHTIQLSYLGTSLDFVPDLSSDDTYFVIDGSNMTLGTGDEILLKRAPYLRYGYSFTNADSFSANTGTISGTFSVDLSPITSFSSAYLASKGTGKGYGGDVHDWTDSTGNQSQLYFRTSYNANIRRNSSTSNSRQRIVFTPKVKRSIGSDIDFSDDLAMQYWLLYTNNSLSNDGETFSLDGWSLNWVRPAGSDGALTIDNGFVQFWIQCPSIGDYTPPVTTTTPQLTTRPHSYTTRAHDYSQYATTPANTIDLSQIEENQRVQIEIENDNRNYNAGTFDGINIIIDQLNDIYAQMQANGDIAVDLLDGLQWSPGSDINNYISNGLTHTTARLPDTFNPDTINSLSDLLMNRSQFGRFAAIGIFSIGFGIFCWFVFRGRGGV